MAYEQDYLDWITQTYGQNALGPNGSVMISPGYTHPEGGDGPMYSTLDKIYGQYQQQNQQNSWLDQAKQLSVNLMPGDFRQGANYQYQAMNPTSNQWENIYTWQNPNAQLHPESGELMSDDPLMYFFESARPEGSFNQWGSAPKPYTWSDDNDFFDSIGSAFEDITDFALGTAGFGVGATTGAAAATGNINSTEDLTNYLQTDLTGLQLANPLANATQSLANSGIGGVFTGATGAAPATGGTLMPPAIPEADPTFGGTLSQTSPGVFENLGNLNSFGNLTGGAVPSPVSVPGAGITETPLDPTSTGNAGAGGTADPTQVMPTTTGVDGMSGAQNIDLSGLNLDALNQGLEGLGGQLTSGLGGISSTLENLFNTFTNQQQQQQQNQQQNQWVNAGMGLLQYQAMKEYQDKLMQTMNRAIDYSDPFHSQRPQYQQQFSQLTQNPSNFFEDPAIKNIIGQQQDASQARLASQGYNMSGNMAHEVNQTGMNAAFGQYMPYTRMIGEAGGAFQGPGQAGNIAANMGGAAAGAGLGAIGALGSSVGSLFGQTPQTGGGTNTGGSVGGSILNDVLKAGGQIFNGIQGLFS